MNPVVMKSLKFAVKVGSIVLPIAVNYFAEKDLEQKIAEKAAEAVAEALNKES